MFNFPKAEKSYLKKSDMERLQITAIQLEATEVELNKQKHLKRPFSLVLRGMRGSSWVSRARFGPALEKVHPSMVKLMK